MLELSSEMIQKLVDEATAAIKSNVVEETKKAIRQSVEYEVAGAVKKMVADYMAQEGAAEFRSALVESNPVLVAAVREASSQMAVMLCEAMVVAFAKRLESEWERKALLQAMFSK